MSNTITVYKTVRLNHKTGEITKLDPVELTQEQFAEWVKPAIPHLVNIMLQAREISKETEREVC